MVWQADITSKPSANTTPQAKSRSFLVNTSSVSCSKPHCRLGCICPQPESSSSSPSLDETSKSSNGSSSSSHCGRYECMFECTCGPRRLRSSARSTTNATTTTTTTNNHVASTNVTTRSAASSNCCDGTYEIGQSRKREASVSSTNSIFSNSRFVWMKI